MKLKIFRTIYLPLIVCNLQFLSHKDTFCKMGPVHCKLVSQQHINFLFLSDNIILY